MLKIRSAGLQVSSWQRSLASSENNIGLNKMSKDEFFYLVILMHCVKSSLGFEPIQSSLFLLTIMGHRNVKIKLGENQHESDPKKHINGDPGEKNQKSKFQQKI